jgi:hypothetical protein
VAELFEFVMLLCATFIVPVLLENSNMKQMRFIKERLRVLWTGVFAFFFLYFLTRPHVMEVTVELRKHLTPEWFGYMVVGICGFVVFCAYWFFIGHVAHQAKKQALAFERTAKFSVMIPFDTAPTSFPIPMDENPDDPLFRTYTDIHSLATAGTVPEAIRNAPATGQVTWSLQPVSTNDAPTFLARLLQYYVFSSIVSLQRDSFTVSVGQPATARPGIEPPDPERYSYDKLSQELGSNIFFRPFRNRQSGDEMAWKIKPAQMPKDTQISFTEEGDKYVVRFQRPDHYRVDFIVEKFMGTGVGDVPKNFVTARKATTMQWTFIVTMRYRIERPDDEDFNPDTYARWLDAIYDGLHKQLTNE